METNVLLVGLTALLADMVRRIVETDRRLRIVGSVGDARDLLELSARTGADVVLTVADGDVLAAPCRDLLYARPRTRIVVLLAQGRDGVEWELRPHRLALGEISRETLLAALLGGSRTVTASREPSA